MQVFIVDGAPPAGTFAAADDQNVLASTYSFPLSIGPASGDRYIIACPTWFTNTAVDITGLTVDGVAATHLVGLLNNGMGAAIYALAVPAGTTATIAFTLTGNAIRAGIDVFSVTGWAGSGFNSATAVTDPLPLSVNVPAYSAVIGVAGATNNFTTDPGVNFTWTGLTEASDRGYGTNQVTGHGSANDNFTAASTPLSVSCDPRHTGTARAGCIVALYN